MYIRKPDKLSGKSGRNLISMFFILLAILLLITACDPGNPTPQPPKQNNPPSNNDNSGNNNNNSQPSGTADLTLSNVNITGVDSQTGRPYFRAEGTVRNNGNADASGFEVSCTYSCPGGTVTSSFFSLVQGGYVAANSSFNYTASVRISCDPLPAIISDVSCQVDENNDVAESNENNNSQFVGSLSLP